MDESGFGGWADEKIELAREAPRGAKRLLTFWLLVAHSSCSKGAPFLGQQDFEKALDKCPQIWYNAGQLRICLAALGDPRITEATIRSSASSTHN